MGATDVQLRFSATAGNDWWIALDNIQVVEDFVLLDEDFDNVQLEAQVDETVPGEFWTHTLPTGWTSSNVGTTPGKLDMMPLDLPSISRVVLGGIAELSRWTVLRSDRLVNIADQGRRNICGKGNFLIADSRLHLVYNMVAVCFLRILCQGDEYDDKVTNSSQALNVQATSPSLDLTKVYAPSVTLQFRSSWRVDNQNQIAKASFSAVNLPRNLAQYYTAIHGIAVSAGVCGF
jgi:hypothetical protein